MSRTTPTLVQAALGADYGPLPNGNDPDLQQYINSVVVTVDRVYVCALSKGVTLSGLPVGYNTSPGSDSPDTELELIERWLAAWQYTQMDKTLRSKSENGASASYSGQSGNGYDSNEYGQTALRIDYSGCLQNLDKQQRASAFHVGSGRGGFGQLPSRIP